MSDGIAIVGMAALFPGAPDLEAFRANLHAGVDAIGDVPPGRWDPAVFLDPSSKALDRFYGACGGFVDRHARFDPLEHGVVPSTVDEAEPDQLIVLGLAVDALRDAGLRREDLPRDTTGVFLGRGGYLGAGLARASQRVREGEQLLAVLRQVLPDVPEADLQAVKRAWVEAAGPLAPDQAIGLVPNLAASRTANRLDLRGPAFTFDAACASALVAVDHAVRELRARRLDAALVGGVHLCHDPVFWSIFSQLGAMSRTGVIRPFDRRADGLLIGEGAGVVLLMREEDARDRGLSPWAVIRGTGVASDGRGATLMSPSPEGQLLALRRAWEDAGLDPTTVGLVEAHGTATAAGDAAELRTLATFFDRGEPVCLGSVKSMIGHAMPAAGIAGLIKAAVAVRDGTWLPTLHCEEPRDELAGTRFEVHGRAVPWPDRGLRRAGVNAFGFGGIDAHVVLEEAAPGRRVRPVPVALYAAADPEALAARLEADDRGGDGPLRVALRDPAPERRTRAAGLVRKGRAIAGRGGTWLGEVSSGRVAFLFPGVEATLDADLASVAEALDLRLPPALEGPVPGLDDLGRRGAAIVGAGRLWHAALGALGVKADVLLGHSIGEWSAIIAGGILDEASIDGFVDSLADETLAVPDVVFGALGTGADRVRPLLKRYPSVVLSHDNCPHQAIVCGPESAVRDLLAEAKVLAEVLPFRSGFHTPHFAPFVEAFRRHVERLDIHRARTPVWSACSVGPWPDDADGVRALLLDHLVKPVRFTETVEALYARGVTTFVQLGAGSLAGFVDDILRGRPHLTIATSDGRRPALDGLAEAAGALWATGVPVDTRRLPTLRDGRGRPLRLGAPLLKLADPPRLSTAAPTVAMPTLPPVAPEGPLAETVLRTTAAVQEAQARVLSALAAPRTPTRQVVRRTLSLATDPYLRDHALFQQPEGWPDEAARYPVVPMTMNVQLLLDAAAGVMPPGRVAVAIERVRAWRWLVVEPPVEITIEAERTGPNAVAVRIPGYVEGTVTFADRWPTAPAPTPLRLTNERPSPIPIERVYADRWMFHGPAYQGMVAVGPFGDDGIVGAVKALPAPGATLDNVGQVFGFWGFLQLPVDSLGFPARIERLRLFGPPPADGTRLDVRARITRVTDESFRGDIEVLHGGAVWCRIEGWQNRRFETDDIVLPLLRMPSRVSLARVDEHGVAWVKERWRTAAARELLIRRYVDGERLAAWEAVDPREQRAWVLRRVAAVDAVREWLWAHGHGPVFPVEIRVDDTPEGLRVHGPFREDLRVAVDVGDGMAVARVAEGVTPRVRLVRDGETWRAEHD